MEASPLERAASAVESLIGTHCENCENPLPSDPAEIVRAVLQAIREPSKGMVEAAANQDLGVPRKDGFIGPVAASIAWHTMIDVALAEQDEFIAIPRLTD